MFLDPLSFYFAVFVMLAAIVTAAVFVRFFNDYSPTVQNKFIVLDGLRGYLAIAVFIHHSAIWYFNLRGDGWRAPSSHFYNNLGQASVALFFMITAFLFFGKLLDTKDKKIDWYRLYISRILRIFPLHICASLVIIFIVLVLSDFTLQQSAFDFIKNTLKFLQFKTPNLNNVDGGLINAGVTWTLRFERSFYMSLPFFALFLGLNVSWVWFAILGASTIATVVGDHDLISMSFVGGIIAAFVVKNNFHLSVFKKSIFGVLALILLVFEMIYFKSSFNVFALILLSIFFIAAVADNVLLKCFSFKASQFLSTISYSIYLLHGIVLFVVFKFVIGFEMARELSALQHWCVVAACAVILVLVSSITYHFIELPFLNLAKTKNLYRPKFIRFLSFCNFKK